MPAFADRIAQWAEQASTSNEAVVIRIRAEIAGSQQAARHEARRISMGFASLRARARKRVMKRDLNDRPVEAPFQDVDCRMAPMSNGEGWQIQFIPRGHAATAALYDVVTESGEKVLNLDILLAMKNAYINEHIQDELGLAPAVDLVSLPLDVDPFTGGNTSNDNEG